MGAILFERSVLSGNFLLSVAPKTVLSPLAFSLAISCPSPVPVRSFLLQDSPFLNSAPEHSTVILTQVGFDHLVCFPLWAQSYDP